MKISNGMASVALGLVLGLSGCSNATPAPPAGTKIKMHFSKATGRVMLRADKGDEIQWNTDVEWVFGQSPCKSTADKRKCEIAQTPKGKFYAYTCKPLDCDPEIALDDSVPLEASNLYADRRPTEVGKIGCDSGSTNGKALIAPASAKASAGDVIRWVTAGDYPPADWKLVFAAGDQAQICKDSAEINQTNPDCIVSEGAALSINYYVQSSVCTTNSDVATIQRK